MNALPWDEIPKNTVFAVSPFVEGPHKGFWGIAARLADGRRFWAAYDDPENVVAAPDRVMAQTILTNLREHSKMKQVAEEIGDWVDASPSGLPDPRIFPVINWDEVPDSVRLQERQFRGEIWGIMALMPDGEHLVMFDQFVKDAGYRNFSATQEEAQGLIAFLEMSQTPPDPQVEERLRCSTSSEPSVPPLLPAPAPAEERSRSFDEREHFDGILSAINEDAERCRVEELGELEKEWRRRLAVGKRGACICGQCRHEFRYKVTKILDWYEESIGYVPTDLELDARRLLDLLVMP